MTRRILGALLLAALVLPAGAADEKKDEKKAKGHWVQLFNGKDLTGWKVYPEGHGNWKVDNGLLVGSGPPSHLFTERGDYGNFRYRVEAMINDHGNSGQYFRTRFQPGFPRYYEAQINSTHSDPVRTGSLYGFDDCLVKEMLVKPGEWFTQEVLADGNHIVIKVNGKTTVDTHVTDPERLFLKGHFALQQHDPGSVVKFRKIEVMELPPTKKGEGTPTKSSKE
jgi:hypothetical protein